MKRHKVISAHVPSWLAECVQKGAEEEGITVSEFIKKTVTRKVIEVLGKEKVRELIKAWRRNEGQ